ncbi:unnamed protein product [Rotaria sp. Silwood1]|nr:unnamed protein product [Rotaria sp. Silwood1]CAF1579526.1 unnamed protein product [Rotaria sp. Silwood1]CAF3717031.1 unnamed protein product [Rotaria sp. Silwood1]CAF4645839.1 unnamed protein product [Rotaria sp. Silwood1]
MTTTTETYLSTQTSFTNETNTTTTTTTTNNEDQSSTIAANVTIDELVQSCCSEVLPSSSQLNSSSSASPTHLVRFVHSQSSLVSQIDEQQRPSEQGTINSSLSSHDTPIKQQQQQPPPLINVTHLPSPYKPKTIIESTNSMQNTTNLSNITANNISVNNYNVNIHTTNVQQQQTNILNNEHLTKKCQFDEKQTTEIVSQILKNIKEVDEYQTNTAAATTTTNYNIHIDSFNFSSTNDQQHSTIIKKSRIKKEAKALTRIIVKDEAISPNFSRNKKGTKNLSTTHLTTINNLQPMEYIPVPYGWQRRILAPDLVVYLSPTNIILDSLDAIRQYLETPSSCKCGLQCPLIVDKVFNFDSTIKSKSWEVTQVLEGTHCRQKSNILEMATLTNCIDSFCETEQKPAKRRKRTHAETANGNVFVCASNSSNILQTNNESTVFVNSPNQTSEIGQSMTWTPLQQTGVTPPSKRPRGRPRKTAVTPPVIAQLAVKPSHDSHQQIQPVPSSILSPPASVSSISQTNLVHRNSTSPSTHHQNTNNNLRYINDNVLTPSSTTDTNVIARVPSLFEQVKTTTNESTFAVLSGVQNVLLSPNRDTNNNNNNKRVRVESSSSSSIVSTTGKPVTLNVNALKPDFVRSPAAAQKPCSTTPNQIDVISLMGTTNNQTQLMVTKTTPKPIAPIPSITNSDDYSLIKSTNEQTNDSSQPLMIDFNDPSTTNFLLSALASGAASDSNAIVNHLFQKAQTQRSNNTSSLSPPPPPPPSTATIKKKLPIISSGSKNCTETTNLLPITNSNTRQPVVLHVPTTTITNDYNQQSQQIIFSSNNNNNNNNGERKQPQQIFFINNKPYVIQQKLPSDQSSQQRLVLTPSITQADELTVHNTPHQNRNIAPAQNNSTNSSGQSTLDDGGNCLVVNGVVEPRTLSTLLKGLNPSSFSGVDNIIDTIHRFEHTTSIEQNDNLLLKPIRTTTKASPARKTNPDKPPARRRAPKKVKQEEQQQQVQVTMPPPPPPPPPPPSLPPLSLPPSIQPIVADQQQWQTDFNSFDFSTAWGSDTNLNSLLLNDDFDTAASFDDVSFGDFEPYMNGNNNNLNQTDTILPSLFGKPLPPDTLPGVDHLLP